MQLKRKKEMKETNFGRMDEMDHWSKTSEFEPLPVGRHKKRKMEAESSFRSSVAMHFRSKLQNVHVYPVSRPAPGASMRRTIGEETRASYPAHGEASRMSKTSYAISRPANGASGRRTTGGEIRASYTDHGEASRMSKTSYPVNRPAHGPSMRRNTGEEIHASYTAHGEASRMSKVSYPVSRPAAGASLRRTTGEEIGADDTDHGQASTMRITSSALQSRITAENFKGTSCLNLKPVVEEQRIIKRNEDAAFSKASTSSQRLEEDDKWKGARRLVQGVVRVFREKCDNLLKEKKSGFRRIDLEAGTWFKREHFAPTEPVVGPIPGVEIGDRFIYRMELHLVGVHQPIQAGIDSIVDINGRRIAVSIVDSGGYDNFREDQKTLIYCGHGGNARNGNRGEAEDQKPKMGNLALMNSIKAKNPIRVIRGSKLLSSLSFIYDGLYTVEKTWKERNPKGNLIFKFKLVRIPGQPSPFPLKNL